MPTAARRPRSPRTSRSRPSRRLLWPCWTRPGTGRSPRLRDRRRRLRRQPQFPGGSGVARRSVTWSRCVATSASPCRSLRRRRTGPTKLVGGVQAPRWWRTIRWREGSHGWLRAQVVALRCWRVTARTATADRLADRRGRQGRQAAVLLEQLRAAHAAGADGGVRPPPVLGGAVSRGSQGTAGLGPVSGAVVDRLPPQQCVGAAGVQFPGVARVPATPRVCPPRQAASAFFPLGPTDGGCRCRRSTAGSSIGCGVRRPRSCCRVAHTPDHRLTDFKKGEHPPD